MTFHLSVSELRTVLPPFGSQESNVPLHHVFLSLRIGTMHCIVPAWKSRKQRSVASRLSISPYRDYALYRSRLEVKKLSFLRGVEQRSTKSEPQKAKRRFA